MKGAVWLISGNTGMAAETARLAVAAGARVYLAGLEEEPGRLMEREFGGACVAEATDLRRVDAAEWVVRACLERFGRLDAVFHAAGASGRSHGDGPLDECTEEGWDWTIDTNLKTAFLLLRPALGWMKANGGGAVLLMSSVVARTPEPRHFATHAYAAAKGALNALTLSLAAYYAPFGIRVNAIAPGLVATPMSRRAQTDPEILKFMENKQPLAGGLLPAAGVAGVAAFLLGDAARYITGQVVGVDGGWEVS
jgi:NAD(P)-dependent dehydrogenase (short-subunit alcohol dehydrogenase family)